jgi:hypothetical protein|tara:strand:- start:738 stop:863 length:126 start_codon:yes stop_codon:yes gene_type:complete
MSEKPNDPKTKRYKTELIAIITLMVIVGIFIVVQIVPRFLS